MRPHIYRNSNKQNDKQKKSDEKPQKNERKIV